jgi:hypothetical protein
VDAHWRELQPRAQGVCMSLHGVTKESVRWRELQPRTRGVCTSLQGATKECAIGGSTLAKCARSADDVNVLLQLLCILEEIHATMVGTEHR